MNSSTETSVEPEYVYRVLYPTGTVRRGGSWTGRQHFYPNRSTAQAQATKVGGTVQQARVIWEDA